MKRSRAARFLALTLALLLVLTAMPELRAQAWDVSESPYHTRYNGNPYYIMVNRQCNTVTIYTVDNDGYYAVPYKAMICSTGRSGHRTPLFDTTLTGWYKRWCYMVDGSYGQYATQIDGNYLFHSVCYTSNRSDRLMNYEYNALGDYASLGCVRLQVADAKWIYDNCGAGTRVTVYDSPDPGPLGKPSKKVASLPDGTGWEPTDPAEGNPWKTVTPAIFSSSKGMGTVSGGGVILENYWATVTATPAEGYQFDGWYTIQGQLLSRDLQYGFSVTDNITVAARFLPCNTVTVSASRSGSASGGGRSATGQTVTVTASGKNGAAFQGWYDVYGNLCSAETAYSFTVSRDRQLYALFAGDKFVDIPAGAWYTDVTMEAADRGLIQGVTDVTFCPDQTLSRAMAATMLARLTGADTQGYDPTPFPDVKKGGWYEDAVNWAYAKGIVNGREGNQFLPEADVTRAEFFTMLYRALGDGGESDAALQADPEPAEDPEPAPEPDEAPEDAGEPAGDLEEPAEAAPTPTSEPSDAEPEAPGEEPGEPVDGEQPAEEPEPPSAEPDPMPEPAPEPEPEPEPPAQEPDPVALAFPDQADIPGYARAAVTELYALGLVNGYEDGCLYPGKTLARNEATALLVRTARYLESSEHARTALSARYGSPLLEKALYLTRK